MLLITDRRTGALLGACEEWPIARRAVADCARAGIHADIRCVTYHPNDRSAVR